MGRLFNNYACPFCACVGKTMVTRTINHRDCIIRTRKCDACGMSHTTVEVSYNIASQVKSTCPKLLERTGAGEVGPAMC